MIRVIVIIIIKKNERNTDIEDEEKRLHLALEYEC